MRALRPYLSMDDAYLPAQQLAASIIDVATARGVNKNKLLKGTGIFQEDIRSGKLLKPTQVLKLIANAQSYTPGNDCAFQVGRRLFPGNYGHISNALMHSRNFTDALRLLSRFRMQICPFISATIARDKHQLHLSLHDAIGSGSQWQFLIECYSTALVSASKLLLGQRLPFYFSFPFARPRYIQEYEENLGFRIQFSQPELSIQLKKSWIEKPFIQKSQQLTLYSSHQCQLQNQFQQGFIDGVRQALMTLPQANLENVARYFLMSPATFKRKLKQHGKSFQQVHDELRRQQAVYLLKVKGLNNEQCASWMAFDDIPNFRRAVKRWTGLTPSQLRTAE